MEMPLSKREIVYQDVLESSTDPDPVSLQKDEEDHVLKPVWATSSPFSHDCLNETLPSNEVILEAMNGLDRPWDDMHYLSYFLPNLVRIEQDDFRSTLSDIVSHVIVPLDMHDIYSKVNMESISPTVTIDISCILGNIENVYIECEIPSIILEVKLLTDTSDLEECLIHLERLYEQH
jgi:hypothetical protein